MSKGEKVCVRDHRPRGDTVGRAPRMLKVQVNRWQRATRSMLPPQGEAPSEGRTIERHGDVARR